ncbi:hypothetical protein ACQKPX_14715 [Photobacterium sp. DNB23_23_1]|uniref:Uncharacterized protein n=1 Tax=Photobacterium pectinilyticum TaxID=2906793 RepID=A0ABT1N6F6_9GAMM|nr:hypothetical protein [Photobacterium sp. ZSDE20]MCQ1060321.1 hypothetical protein [Photobacterium sp. ZSDE20]MDD1828154.1 hypothetical protein [Photobacterium sp. ZSDE20]
MSKHMIWAMLMAVTSVVGCHDDDFVNVTINEVSAGHYLNVHTPDWCKGIWKGRVRKTQRS